MDSKKDVRKLPALIAGIKIEPGTLGALPGRLPSFGGRRDLTLGSSGPSNESKPKRLYTPNLNVQRNKNKADINIKEEHSNSKEKRERRKDDGKGRKREKANNLIQSTGVFAEGIAGGAKKGYGRGGGGGGGGGAGRDSANNFIPKPKLNLQHDRKIDKVEEEMKLKELLRDDFVDDPGMEPDAGNAPVQLPLLAAVKLKHELKEEVKPKVEEIDGGIKIKQEILDEEDEKDVKPKIENGEIKFDKEPEITKMKKPELITIEDVLRSKEPELIFLQLPDCLPGLKPESETGPARPSTSAKPSTSVASQSLPNDTTQAAAIPKHCTLNTLSEGCIGKLQLLKSGKARLVLGNTVLQVDMGTQVGFREDLIAVDLDESTHGGDMINLGAVKTRLVCSPDWEKMLTKAVS